MGNLDFQGLLGIFFYYFFLLLNFTSFGIYFGFYGFFGFFLDFSLDLRDFVRISLIFWIFLGFSGSWSFSKGTSSLEWLEIFALLFEFSGIFWIFNGFLDFWDYFGSLGNYLGFLECFIDFGLLDFFGFLSKVHGTFSSDFPFE